VALHNTQPVSPQVGYRHAGDVSTAVLVVSRTVPVPVAFMA
jgi:hypothetical protein